MEKIKKVETYFLAITGKENLKAYGIKKMPKLKNQFVLEVVKVTKDGVYLNLTEK